MSFYTWNNPRYHMYSEITTKTTHKALKLYSGTDPREIPSYAISEVSRVIGVPVATLRTWTRGRYYPTHAGARFFKPVIEVPDASRPLLSFVNLVEAHVLSAIRRKHEVPFVKVRKSLDYLARRFPQVKHPLADQQFETDGIDL